MIKLTDERIAELYVEHGCEGEDVEGFARAIEAEVLRINGVDDTGPVFDFTAREKAMALASMLAGSVGMNDVPGSEGYRNDLRAHLTQFMKPRATGCPDTMDDMGRFAVDQKAADEEKSPPATRAAG